MAEQQLNILLILRDQLSSQMKNATSAVANFNQSCIHLGRQLQQVGRNMSFVGAGAIAPFMLALNNVKSSSFAVAGAMETTAVQIERFNSIVAQAALPVVEQFNGVLSLLADALENVNPQLRENVTRFTMLSGGILLSAGAMTIFTGAIVKLAPAITAISVAMLAVVDTGNSLTNSLKGGVAGLGGFLAQFADDTKRVKAIQDFKNSLKGGVAGLGGFLAQFADDTKRVKAIQDFKDSLQNLKDMIANIGKIDPKEIMSQFGETIDFVNKLMSGDLPKSVAKAESAMKTFEKVSMDTAKQVAQAFKTSLGDTLFQAITGKIHGLRSAIAAFGEDLMRIAAQAIAVFALRASLNAAVPGLGSLLFFHSGGMVYPRKAHGGLAPDEVPIIAQTGEGVLSRRGMSALGGSDRLRRLNRGEGMGGDGGTTISPIVVVQAWDTSDIMRNRKTLEAIIANSIARNGEVRKAMKLYG